MSPPSRFLKELHSIFL